MKKEIAKLLRRMANWVYPEFNIPLTNILRYDYKIKKVRYSRLVNIGMQHSMQRSLNLRGISDDFDFARNFCIEDAKKMIKEDVCKTIRENDIIEYSFSNNDKEDIVVNGELIFAIKK